MSVIYAFYNPFAENGECRSDVYFLDLLYDEPIVYCDLTKSETYEHRLFSLTPDDTLILCGGDGTLNRFRNLLSPDTIPCDILFFPLGKRNAVALLSGHDYGCQPFSVRHWLENPPKLYANGRTLCFLGDVRWVSRISVSAVLTVDGVAHHFARLRALTVRRNPDGLLEACADTREHLFRRKDNIRRFFGRDISIAFQKGIAPLIDGDILSAGATVTARLSV